MSFYADILAKVRAELGSRNPKGSTQKCPLAETGLIVLVLKEHNEEMIPGMIVDLKGKSPFGKQTDGDGIAKFKPIEPDTYTVTATLPSSLVKLYEKPATQSAGVPLGSCPICIIPVVMLARPKIKVVWEQDGKALPGVGVVLSAASAYDYKDTKENGLAEWAANQPGLKPGSYSVQFTFKGRHAHVCEVIDNRTLKVPPGCEETFPFKVRPSWVEFVITDQFDNPVSEIGYLLLPTDGSRQFPDGSKRKSDKLKRDGKVREDAPPGKYRLALKVVSDASWATTPLEIEKTVRLKAFAPGYDDDTAGTFEIFDAHGLGGSPLETVNAKVRSGALEADWKPTEAKLKEVRGGHLVFLAKVEKSVATSPAAPISIKRPFELKDKQGPLNTRLTLVFSGGHRVETTTQAGKAEPLVPLGERLLWVELPEHPGVRASLDDQGDQHEFQTATSP